MGIFATFATIFLIIEVVVVGYYRQKVVIYILAGPIFDFPVIGYLVFIHHLNYKSSSTAEAPLTTAEATSDNESQLGLESTNDEIFADLFLMRRSLYSSCPTSLKVSQRSINEHTSTLSIMAEGDMILERESHYSEALGKYNHHNSLLEADATFRPPSDAQTSESVNKIIK